MSELDVRGKDDVLTLLVDDDEDNREKFNGDKIVGL